LIEESQLPSRPPLSDLATCSSPRFIADKAPVILIL